MTKKNRPVLDRALPFYHKTVDLSKTELQAANPLEYDCFGCALHIFLNQWVLHNPSVKRQSADVALAGLVEAVTNILAQAPPDQRASFIGSTLEAIASGINRISAEPSVELLRVNEDDSPIEKKELH